MEELRKTLRHWSDFAAREICIALNHPNICTVHDFAMPAEPSSLWSTRGDPRCPYQEGPLPLDETLKTPYRAALDEAHCKGIIHPT
jgi:hypothetical protein